MIRPELPQDLQGLQVNLLVHYDLDERTGKPRKPAEVGFRARLKDVESPEEVWWEVKAVGGPKSIDSTEKAALAMFESDVLPAIRELLPKIDETVVPPPAQSATEERTTALIRMELARMGMTLSPIKVE